jgi:hypothetical protein
LKTGFEQFLSLPKNIPLCCDSWALLIGLLGKEINSEVSSGLDADVEPVDDFLLGISLNFNNCSSSSIRFRSISGF